MIQNCIIIAIQHRYTLFNTIFMPKRSNININDTKLKTRKRRRLDIHNGYHYKDTYPDCNINNFNSTYNLLLNCKVSNQYIPSDINKIICEYSIGIKDPIDDRCPICLKNKRINFIINNISRICCWYCQMSMK